ncbi:MAG: carbohydrate-binding domain-containing protein [Lachnospiraceae bacterium]
MLRKKALMAILAAGFVATSIPATPLHVQAKAASVTMDYNEEDATKITFSDTSASASDPEAVTIKNDTAVTIDKSGTYVFSGTCKNGSIAVKKNTADVTIVLDGLDLTSTETAPISCKSSTGVQIIVKDGTQNTLTDTDADADEDDGQAGIKVKKDSTFSISGTGTLTVNGQKKNAIKAGANVIVTVKEVTLNVTSAKHGISVEHKLNVESGNLNIIAENDGLKASPDTDTTTDSTTTDTTKSTDTGSSDSSSDASTDTSEGSITLAADSCKIQAKGDGIQAAKDIQITNGTYDITASEDGIQADNDITIDGGSYTIQTNGGSTTTLNNDSASCKAIKAVNNITISGGTFDINSADDAIHSDAYVTVKNGTIKILTGDDGIHATTTLTVGEENTTGPSIDVQKSYEGLESAVIYLNSGDISVVASDDGINAAGGNSGTNTSNPGGQFPGFGGSTGSSAYAIHVNGGTINVNSGSDGFDSNGNIYFNGGTTNVQSAAANGPGSDGFPLDHDGTLAITGGTIFAAGSNQMVELPDATASTQAYTAKSLTSAIASGTEISIKNAAGDSLAKETLLKNSNFVFYSSPEMSASDTYSLVNEATGETIASSDSNSMGGGGFGPGQGGGNRPSQGEMPSRPNWGGSMPSRPNWGDMPSFPWGDLFPSQPSETPSDGSTPSEPGDGSTPSQPSDASTPAQPSETPSSGSTPSQPGDTSRPAQPSDTSTPSQPDDASTPAQPSEGSETSRPSGFDQPSRPNWGDMPSFPWGDLFPSFPGEEPSEGSTPSEPSDGSTPTQPTVPGENDKPSQTTEPSKEEKPSQPVKPSENETPSQPTEKPSESETPSQPTEKPSENETPSQPTVPSENETPSQPTEKPSESETPSQPSKEEGSTPSNLPEEPGLGSTPSQTEETPSEAPSNEEQPSQPDTSAPSEATTPSEPTAPSETVAQNAKKAGLSITLSASSYKYNGKVHKPSVTVKTKNGKKVSTKNYTVSYSSGCKKVGIYSVKVTFKGDYKGTWTKTFSITPTGTNIKKLTSASKGFSLTWKKQATQTTGYQIQCSTTKNFASAKTVTINSTSTTTKKLANLASKKKYYVRIRTFKTVDGKKVVSTWSSAKSIKTK